MTLKFDHAPNCTMLTLTCVINIMYRRKSR